MTIKDFRDLKIWQRSIVLAKTIYNLLQSFPKNETYGIFLQIKRSVVSVSSNIAEGFARQYNKEYKQYLFISLGSCAELITQLTIASEVGLTKTEKTSDIIGEIEETSKMIMSLIKKFK